MGEKKRLQRRVAALEREIEAWGQWARQLADVRLERGEDWFHPCAPSAHYTASYIKAAVIDGLEKLEDRFGFKWDPKTKSNRPAKEIDQTTRARGAGEE